MTEEKNDKVYFERGENSLKNCFSGADYKFFAQEDDSVEVVLELDSQVE